MANPLSAFRAGKQSAVFVSANEGAFEGKRLGSVDGSEGFMSKSCALFQCNNMAMP
jgi:hypothetical protein